MATRRDCRGTRALLDRRGLLLGTGALAAGLALPAIVQARDVFKSDPFSLGLASGDPAHDGFVIWTRIAPSPLEPGGGLGRPDVEVRWEVGDSEAMTRIVQSGTATARAALAHAVHVEVGGLEPGRDYYYRFEAGGVRSPTGRAKTLPGPGSVATVRFISAGCQRYEDGYFTAWRRIAGERSDFVLHYGDYIYEYSGTSPATSSDRPIVRHMPGRPGKCVTLEDFRNRYAIYKLDRDLQAAHASAPFMASFDDHEVENNWAGFASAERGISREEMSARRRAAFQAWYEHMPLRAAQLPRGPEILAYRRFQVGGLMQVDVLDTRQYRSPQACGDGWKTGCTDADRADRTMLGAAQERWLAAGFEASRARWNVLAQQVPIARFDRDPDPAVSEVHMDKWDGATAARDRLFSALADARIANVVSLAGDVHQNRASELKRNFDDTNSQTVGVEFVATSISSAGDGQDSPPIAAKAAAANPHLKFFNGQRGYVRHTVTAERWRADYVVLDKVSERNAADQVRTALVVEAGSRRLHRA